MVNPDMTGVETGITQRFGMYYLYPSIAAWSLMLLKQKNLSIF